MSAGTFKHNCSTDSNCFFSCTGYRQELKEIRVTPKDTSPGIPLAEGLQVSYTQWGDIFQPKHFGQKHTVLVTLKHFLNSDWIN